MSHCYYCGHGIKSGSQGYFNRIKTLRRWVYSKQLSKYESLILDLALSLQNLLPQEKVKIKERELDDQIKEKISDEKMESLYELLTYGLCLLNQSNRMYEDHHWIVEREDQMTALLLLQPKLIPESMLDLGTRMIYQRLIEEFYPDDFTMKEATMQLRIARSTLHRHVMAMENCGYIERVGGDKRAGYSYNIGYWPWKK